MIRMNNVSFGYEQNVKVGQAVRDLNIHIARGECVALLGENGAGKTTTVKLMSGLIRPVTGTVEILGKDTRRTRVSERAKHVGFLFQDPDRQICKNTVLEEVLFGLETCREDLAREEQFSRAQKMIDFFELDENAEPFSLSRSQRQRVALASILVVDPEILILDEPTTGLDYRECCQIMDLIQRMNKEKGTTIVMVCHDMEVVLDYADRALVMAGGQLLRDAKVKEVFRDAQLMTKASILAPQLMQLAAIMGGPFSELTSAEEFSETVLKERSKGGRGE